MEFHLLNSGISMAATSDLVGVIVVVNERGRTAFLQWVPLGKRLCAVRHRCSRKVDNRRPVRLNLVVFLVYMPTSRCPNRVRPFHKQQVRAALLLQQGTRMPG